MRYSGRTSWKENKAIITLPGSQLLIWKASGNQASILKHHLELEIKDATESYLHIWLFTESDYSKLAKGYEAFTTTMRREI